VNAVEEIRQALLGWRDLAQFRPGWRARFVPTPEGLRTAATFYGLAVVLNVGLQMAIAGQAGVAQVVVNLGLNVVPLAGLALAVAASLWALGLGERLFAVLVPATWALAFALIAGMPLSLLQLPAGALLLIALAYLYYRLGRAACAFPPGLGAAFAAICLVLLVALPLSLYMLVAAVPGLS
jgi:hypothetical protein